MAIKKGMKGLGKGLESLIPLGSLDGEENRVQATAAANDQAAGQKETEGNAQEKETGAEVYVKISKVEPNRDQPRKQFNEDSLDELADSIRQFGIIQPLLVQEKGDHYEIIAGERRWRAAKIAGLKEVPVLIRNYTEQEIMEIALIENIQREDLNPIEEAKAYQRLIDEFHIKHEEIADRVSKSRSFITNSMRLLKLNTQIQTMVIEGILSSGHARAILGLPTDELQLAAAQKVVDEDLSVRATEKLVKDMQKTAPAKTPVKKEKRSQIFYEELESKLSAAMSTKVHIKDNGNNRGKIEIEYYTLEDLERLQTFLEH